MSIGKSRSRVLGVLLSVGVLSVAPLTGGAQAVPAWSPEEQVTTHVFDVFEDPETQVGVARDGTAVVAWLQEDAAAEQHLYLARRAANGMWSSPLELSSPLDPYEPWDLSVGANGNASIVWSRTVSGTQRIEESHYVTPGGGWTSPTLVGYGSGPDVAVDGDGVITVAWAYDGIRMRTREANGTWSTESLFSADPSSYLTMTANPSGALVLAWQRFSKPRMVRAALKPAGGDWGAAPNLMANKRIGSLDATISDTGEAFVAWTTTGEWNDAAHVYRNGVAWARTQPAGAWSSARYLNRSIGEDGGSLDLSMNPSGQAIVTWMAAGGGSNGWRRLYAARYSLGDGWGPTRKLARGWYDPRAWIDDNGLASVIADRGKIWQFTQPAGGAWSSATEVAGGDLGDAVGAGTTLLMVWTDQDDAMRARLFSTE